MQISGIDHVQITIPSDCESEGRHFYCVVLGLHEVEKPSTLKANGGFWLETGGIPLHIGLQDGVDRSQLRAHVAFAVESCAPWRERLMEIGIRPNLSTPIPGYERFEFRDPFGNRLEIIATNE